MENNQNSLASLMKERFQQLPMSVQRAITSADIQKRLRALAEKQKLHLDQWQTLENEVMLTLLGFQQVEHLEDSIRNEVGVSADIAAELARDINAAVFIPVREELERELSHPQAKEETVSDVDAARTQALQEEQGIENATPETPTAPAGPQPGTAPPPKPEAVVQAPDSASSAYKPGESSSSRRSVHDDPYREPAI